MRDRLRSRYNSCSLMTLLLVKLATTCALIMSNKSEIIHVASKSEIITHACMYVCMYVCMHACMHACVCVCMCMYVYVCMCVCMWWATAYVCMHVLVSMGNRLCSCTWISSQVWYNSC